MIRQFFISSMAFLSISAAAQQQAERLSLKQCFDIAIANNYGIKAAWKNVERADAMQRTAWDIDKTEFSLSQDPTSGGGPDNAISLTQQIDFPTAYIAKGRMLKAETRARQKRVQLACMQLKGDLAALYYQMLYQQQVVGMLQRQDSVIARFCGIAAKRYEAGETRQLEKLSAERKLMANRQELARAREELNALQLRMKTLMNSNGLVLPAESQIVSIAIDGVGFDFIKTPEGQYAQSQVDVATKAVAVAKNGYAPSLSLSLRNQFVLSSWNPYNQDRSRFSGGNFMGFEVGIGVPLFFGATKAKVKAAKKEREAAELEMRQSMVQRNQEYAELLGKLNEARCRMDYYSGDDKKRIGEMVRLAELEYENGEISYLEYAAVLDDGADHSMKSAAAVNDYNQAVVSLLRITGGIDSLNAL